MGGKYIAVNGKETMTMANDDDNDDDGDDQYDNDYIMVKMMIMV